MNIHQILLQTFFDWTEQRYTIYIYIYVYA